MQHSDRWPEDYDPEDTNRTRAGSRRNSGSGSRRNSIKREKEKKNSPLRTAPNSSSSTPKKNPKAANFDFVVTGKQIVRSRCYDRANSLPGGYHRRPSSESLGKKTEPKRNFDSPKRHANTPSSRSRDTSLDEDFSLDFSQVSDFEDTNSKYGVKPKFGAFATSTPKNFQKSRSGSMQSQVSQNIDRRKCQNKSFDSRQSRESTYNHSRDSFYKTSSTSPFRCGVSTELDYSSVSPEYSGQSSAEQSPRGQTRVEQETQHNGSSCVSTWQDYSEVDNTKVEEYTNGEWSNFWANYNNSIATVPLKSYYDQCPTPYRTENIELTDMDVSAEASNKFSPENLKHLNTIIRNEGLHLTPRETQNIIKCAHVLGNVLSKAIERRTNEKHDTKIQVADPVREIKKKNLTLELKETHTPAESKEKKRSESVTTQTDISLPNTKSAPKIFENILRQLSRSSIDEVVLEEAKKEKDSVKNEQNIKNGE